MDVFKLRELFNELSIELSGDQVSKLVRLSDWLESEGVTSGGIGPNEVPHLLHRHIGDAAAFASVVDQEPRSLLDIGSGVGLPGSVLAILWPSAKVTLLDRSGRRAGLARRLARIVDLPNVSTVQQDVSSYIQTHGLVVMRAALQARAALPHMARLCDQQAVLALSRSVQEPSEARTWVSAGNALGVETSINVVQVLDPPAWLLSMVK